MTTPKSEHQKYHTSKMNKINTSVVVIDHESAQKILERSSNPNNRKISTSTVTNYAKSMINGEWKLNGEAIVFDRNGILMNGHHRLHAVVQAKASIEFLIVDGVSDESFHTYDGGKKRSAADELSMAGNKNCTVLAAIVSSHLVYNDALVRKGSYNTWARPSKSMVIKQYQSYRKDYDLVMSCCKFNHVVSPSVIGFAFAHILIDLNFESSFVMDFSQKLGSGEMLKKGDPVFTLREALIRAKNHKDKSSNWKKNAFITALNKEIAQQPLNVIRFKDENKAIKIVK